jgi:aspartate carbamoyltransferase regulatory subunit
MTKMKTQSMLHMQDKKLQLQIRYILREQKKKLRCEYCELLLN